MEETKNEQLSKPTYEQLEQDLLGLRSMNNQLIMQLQQSNLGNLFKRLEFLFKVLEQKDSFNKTFVDKCSEEIELHMTLTEEDSKE